MSGAWSKGTNKAVASAPPAGGLGGHQSSQGSRGGGGGRNNNNQNRRGSQNNSSRGGGGGGDNQNRRGINQGGGGGDNNSGGRGRGGGRGGNNNNQNNNNNNNNNQNRRGSQNGGGRGGGRGGNNNNRITHRDVQMLNETGLGGTPAQQKVIRINAREFVQKRLKFIEPCTEFSPHSACEWTDDNRLAEIQALCSKVMELGDVSKNNNNPRHAETAPPIDDCKPLVTDEGTRWKSKAMTRQSSLIDEAPAMPQTTDEIVAHALLILNKVSLTTLDRLTGTFMKVSNLAENEAVRKEIIVMLVDKAQKEPHFGPMYAQLCTIIAKKVKPFKKELLTECQKEFEMATEDKIKAATVGVTDADEIEYHATLIRKAYVGHMKFLGELYLRDVVKLTIMMHCLDELLKDEEHEDSLECFANLMTTMGEKLETHAKQNKKPFDWAKVADLRNSNKISARIKFLLQDLLELRSRGWISRRKEEKAQTIAEIHKEVAQEERQAKMNGGRRVSSQQNLRRSTSLASTPTIDDDGFTQINRASIKKVGSKLDVMTLNDSPSPIGGGAKPPSIPSKPSGALRRSQSQPASMSASHMISPFNKKAIANKLGGGPMAPPMPETQEVPSGLSPDECLKKSKTILKEYFVGGDTDDAVLSVHETVQVGKEGSIERGAKIIEGGTMLVMEMKEQDVAKMMTVMTKCVQDGKIEKESIAKGFSDPLEYLSDIEIDAPLARSHLATIVAECLKLGAFQLDFLKEAPEYFRTDGKAAPFAVKVLKKRGGDPSDDELNVVGALMTDDDKKSFASAKAMFDA